MNYMRNFEKNNRGIRVIAAIIALFLGLSIVSYFASIDAYATDELDPYHENSVSQSKAEPVDVEASKTVKSGIVSENGSIYYYINGSKQYGRWIKSGSIWYYAKSNGALARNEKLKIGSYDYVFDNNGMMYSGLFRFNNSAYLTDGSGHILKSGWKKYNGKWYYAQANGILYSNTVRTIGSSKFGFDYYGTMYTNLFGFGKNYFLPDEDGYILTSGWKYRNGKWYYARSNGLLYVNGVYTINGEKYGFSEEGKMYTGKFTVGGKSYLAASSGEIYRNGWKYIDSYWYYLRSDGTLASNGKYRIDSNYYCFDNNGRMYKNKFDHNGRHYLAASSGELFQNRWRYYNGVWYLSKSDGSLYTDGFYNVGRECFAFDSQGRMFEREFAYRGKRYITNSRGDIQKNGWKKENNNWYYARRDGSLYYDSFYTIGKEYFCFDSNGRMLQGAFGYRDKRYITNSRGDVQKGGWIQKNNNWYYARKNGSLYSNGFYNIGKECFGFDETGKMYYGEFERRGRRYVTNSRGDVQKNGWVKPYSTWYYANSDGSLYTNTIKRINGSDYAFDYRGRMHDGLFKFQGKRYATSYSGAILKNGWCRYRGDEWVVADSSGVLMVNKWYKYQNKYYYAKSNGIFARLESLTLGGKTYYFDDSCASISKKEYVSMKNSVTNILNVARKEIGTNTGKKYWDATFNGRWTYSNGTSTPWCACFVNWCHIASNQAGKLSGLGNKAYCPSYVNWSKNRGTWGTQPRPGDMILFNWSGGSIAQHIGFVESVNGRTITTIEGNTGSTYQGEVKRNTYNINSSYILGYIHL